MNLIELDGKLIQLQKDYKSLSDKYDWNADEIESLENEQECLESDMNIIEQEIEEIKKQMLTEKIDSLNVETDDPFLKDFIQASYFCDKDSGVRPVMEHVNITDDEIQACDGYKAIIIKNLNIPVNLKNTKIKWDIRENFETNVNMNLGDFIKLKNVYPPVKSFAFTLEGMAIDDFYEKLQSKPYEHSTSNTITIVTDRTIGVKKEYMDIALLAFKGEKFNIHSDSPVSPILLENELKQVLVLPVRLMK